MSNERDEARKNRLAAALRENLKRRKQQLKGRAEAQTEPADGDARRVEDSVPAKDRAKPPR